MYLVANLAAASAKGRRQGQRRMKVSQQATKVGRVDAIGLAAEIQDVVGLGSSALLKLAVSMCCLAQCSRDLRLASDRGGLVAAVPVDRGCADLVGELQQCG